MREIKRIFQEVTSRDQRLRITTDIAKIDGVLWARLDSLRLVEILSNGPDSPDRHRTVMDGEFMDTSRWDDAPVLRVDEPKAVREDAVCTLPDGHKIVYAVTREVKSVAFPTVLGGQIVVHRTDERDAEGRPIFR